MTQTDILHGDCKDIIPSLEHNIDLTFLDPPFNQGKEYENYNDSLPEAEYWNAMENVCRLVHDKTSDGGCIYFMQREKNIAGVLDILAKTDWTYQNTIIWRKKLPGTPMQYRYPKNYQIIIFATKGTSPKTFNQLRINPELPRSYKYERVRGIQVSDVWDDIRELTSGYLAGREPLFTADGGRFHYQQTSLGILLRIILSSSMPGDTILDPFAGTGTTATVASQLGRNSISIEQADKNVQCIKKRTGITRDIDNIDRRYAEYQYTDNLDAIWGHHPQNLITGYTQSKIITVPQ